MFPTTTKFCEDTVHHLNHKSLEDLVNVTFGSLISVCYEIAFEKYAVKVEGKFSEPMVLIGIYISIASLVCLLAMALDLLYAFRARKYWFPTKYFSLNAISITVIAVAMKLLVDLSSPMPTALDQVSKIGGLAFMCTMMSNFMPSLASMDNRSLLANVAGLSIFVVTLIVNMFIQIRTRLIRSDAFRGFSPPITLGFRAPSIEILAYIYIGILLFLLIILISSAITVPTSKKILKYKYDQATSRATLNNPQANLNPTIQNLKQNVKKYWMMAETGSPQFVVASSSLSFASGVLCLISMLMYISVAWWLVPSIKYVPHEIGFERWAYCELRTSAYKWSIKVIVLTQTIGIIVGSCAPIGRCFIFLRFKPFSNQIRKHLAVLEVDKYWTQNLCAWKENVISFLSSGRRSRVLLNNLKNGILSFCIGFQKVVVVSCKMIALFPVALIVDVTIFFKSVKAMIVTTTTASSSGHTNEDLSNYVLLLEDNMQLSEKTMKGISDSMDRLIQKAESNQHNNLLELLGQSDELAGVKMFENDQYRSPLSVVHVNSWSLPIISLTCIAIVIPNIPNDRVDNLFESVGEGLLYTHLVEKSLNREPVYVNIRRASLSLWHEVEANYKWLGNTLKRSAYEGKSPLDVIKLLAEIAQKFLNESNASTNGVTMENLPPKSIAANSMYRIATTIFHTYASNRPGISGDELFKKLSIMIADILAACLTNIPRVITMRCQESAIEKQESSVEAAIDLLGRTTEIINTLEPRVLPNMDPNKMGYIDEWRRH